MFLVRKGNPKDIRDWDDLVKPGRLRHHAEPEDLRRRTMELPRGLGLRASSAGPAATTAQGGGVRGASVSATCRVLDSGARAATTTFAQRGIGDVLDRVGERGAAGASRRWATAQVLDRRAVADDPRRTAGGHRRSHGGSPRARGRRRRRTSSSSTRPRRRRSPPDTISGRASPDVLARYRAKFPDVRTLLTIDGDFGGWGQAQKRALRRRRRSFDRIYAD